MFNTLIRRQQDPGEQLTDGFIASKRLGKDLKERFNCLHFTIMRKIQDCFCTSMYYIEGTLGICYPLDCMLYIMKYDVD